MAELRENLEQRGLRTVVRYTFDVDLLSEGGLLLLLDVLLQSEWLDFNLDYEGSTSL